MKVALIEPKPFFNSYYFWKKLPLLGTLILGTILKNRGHEVKVFKENIIPAYNEKNDELHPFLREADVVGFTAITPTAKRAYEIARAIKRQFPEKKVIFGGSHPSALPDEALQYGDNVVIGEAENVIVDLVEGRINDGIIRGPQVDINDVPPLDLSILEGFRIKRGKIDMKFAPIMASRGCPYDCKFCSVTRMFGRKYKVKDADIVMEEVMMRYSEGFRKAFFYDDNFAAIPSKTKELLEKLIKANLDFSWSSQFRIEVARDREMLELLKRAKCTTLFIGVESINPEALKELNKHENAEEVKSGIKTLLDYGFHVHSMFILGSDSDTEESMEETIRYSKESKTSTAQFSILFPIPGTRLYDELKEKNRLFIQDWNYYDGSHVVFLPKNVTPIKLQRKFFHSYKYFYNKNILFWLMSRVGFMLWKWHNRLYMKYIRFFTRKLKREGILKEGILTLKGLLTSNVPRALPKLKSYKHLENYF